MSDTAPPKVSLSNVDTPPPPRTSNFESQCIVTEFANKFQVTRPSLPTGVFRESNIDKTIGAYIRKSNARTSENFLNIESHKLSFLQPYIKIWQRYAGNKRRITFDTYMKSGTVQNILSSRGGRNGAGIKSISWKDVGTNPTLSGKQFLFDIEYYFQSVQLAFDDQYRFLFMPERIKVDASNAFAFSIELGYDTKSLDRDIFTNADLASIQGARRSFDLSLQKHEISITNEGYVTLTVQYLGLANSKALVPAGNVLSIKDKKISDEEERILTLLYGSDRALRGRKKQLDILDRAVLSNCADIDGNDQVLFENAKRRYQEEIDKITAKINFRKFQLFAERVYGPGSANVKQKLFDVSFLENYVQSGESVSYKWPDDANLPDGVTGDFSFEKLGKDKIASHIGQYVSGLAGADEITEGFSGALTARINAEGKVIQAGATTTPTPISSDDDTPAIIPTPSVSAVQPVYYISLADIISAAVDATNITSPESEGGLGLSLVFGKIKLFQSAGQPTINLLDLPISIKTFARWYFTNVIEKKLSSWGWSNFIDSVCTELIPAVLSPKCFDRVSTFQQSLGQEIRQEYIETVGRTPSEPQGSATTDGKLMNAVLYISTLSGYAKPSGQSTSSYIYSLKAGRKDGLVKSINFSRVDIPGRREAAIAKSFNEDPDDSSGLRYKEEYKAEIVLFGNSIWRPGSVLRIEGVPGVSNKKAEEIGLRGYFLVLEASSSIQDGKWETTLVAQFQGGIDSKSPVEYFKEVVQERSKPPLDKTAPTASATDCKRIREIIKSQGEIEKADAIAGKSDLAIAVALAGEVYDAGGELWDDIIDIDLF
jgi:hypothetical protein